jgi:hypothetical protein
MPPKLLYTDVYFALFCFQAMLNVKMADIVQNRKLVFVNQVGQAQYVTPI